MAAITYADICTLRDKAMGSGARIAVIIAIPTATSDATAGVFLVKDPDGNATAANTTANQEGNCLGGDSGVASSWKSFSYANLATAYSL